MTRVPSTLGATMAVVIAMSGCTAASEVGDPPPTEQTTTSSLEIPSVAQALDVRAFVSDPCALFDVSQRRELGLPAAVRGEDVGESTCDLHVDAQRQDSSNYLRVVVFAGGGLDEQYAQCGTLDCSRWTTDSVDGYPVVRATDDLTSEYGSCKIFLGVANDAVLVFVDVAIDPAADGPDCGRADLAASMALATLR